MKISEIITPVNCQHGAPMGRSNEGTEPITVIRGRNGRICACDQTKVYQKRVRLDEGYDIGGAYWGMGKPLYVRFTKDFKFIQFFRM